MGSDTDGVFDGIAPPLVVSSYTLGTEVSFPDRCRAAAAAGYDGIGLRAENYWDAQDAGLSDTDMLGIAEQHGVRILEVEYLTGWGTPVDRNAAQQRKEQTVFAMARAFGVKHMNAGLIEKPSIGEITEAFAGLCDRAGDDLVVALEFMPYSGVPDIGSAWQIMHEADRSNSGLIVDTWHWARSGATPADLGPVPGEAIIAVQLCDVLQTPMDEPRAESLGYRLPPGEGYGGTLGMVRALRDRDVRPRLIGVEVISNELVSQGIDAAAQTCGDAARRVLADARSAVSTS
jgi:sugar phosphate isomerase/epimerase